MISKFNSHLSDTHITAAKLVLQYLKGTADLSLKYQNDSVAGDQYGCHSTTSMQGNCYVSATV